MNEKRLLKRITANFKKNKIYLLIFLLIWTATVVLSISHYGNTLGKQSLGNEVADSVVEVSKDVLIKQNVMAKDIVDCDSICIKFATFARKNQGNVYIRINDNAGELLIDKTIPIKNIQDNAFYTISFGDKIDLDKITSITLTVSADSNIGESVGVYYSHVNAFDRGNLFINEEAMDGDLALRFLKDDDNLRLFYRIIITWTISSFTLIILLLLLYNPKPEYLFAIICLCFGVIYLLIITPMSVPDETPHYEYSFQISNFILKEDNYRMFDEEYQNYGSFAGHLNISAAYSRFIRRINRPLSLDNNDVYMTVDINESYKTCFIVPGLGIALARLLNWNMLRTFYLGRFFNLLFYTVCVFIAIKKTPIHKTLFGIIATLPILMQQAASFSYDCFINGLMIVLISCVLKWIFQEETISLPEFIFVFIVNLLLAPIKVVYGLFSFLFIFVPYERYGNKNKKLLATMILLAPAIYELTTLLFPLLFRIIRKIYENLSFASMSNNYSYASMNHSSLPTSYSDNEMYTFSYVINHPLEAIDLLLRTIRYGLKIWFYAAIGRALSGNSLILPTTLVHLILALLIGASFIKQDYIEKPSFKIFSLFLCVIAGLMMLAGMLVSWTEMNQEIVEDYGGPIIQGVQGRYFSPLLYSVFPILNNKKINISQKADKCFIFALILLTFEVIIYVLSYTFVN